MFHFVLLAIKFGKVIRYLGLAKDIGVFALQTIRIKLRRKIQLRGG